MPYPHTKLTFGSCGVLLLYNLITGVSTSPPRKRIRVDPAEGPNDHQFDETVIFEESENHATMRFHSNGIEGDYKYIG